MTVLSTTVTAAPCLGLDAAKAKIDACLLLGTCVHHHQFDNAKAGLAALRAWCQKLGAPTPLTVLEATGRYGDLAALTLHDAGHRVHLANARRIKDYARSLGRRNKTDRLDAQLIADFGRTRALPAWQPPAPPRLICACCCAAALISAPCCKPNAIATTARRFLQPSPRALPASSAP